MPHFEGEISYMLPDGYFTTTEADDADDAEFKMTEELKETHPEATMVVVDNIKEVKI